MSRVEFHFNAPALQSYACRLLRKVHARGLRAQVIGLPNLLSQLDQALWTFSSLDFLPHCLPHAPDSIRHHSAVLLTPDPCMDWHRQVLINLGDVVPQNFEQFERVIEVVSTDDLHRAQARERWRHYQRQGCDLIRHDLSGTPSDGQQ